MDDADADTAPATNSEPWENQSECKRKGKEKDSQDQVVTKVVDDQTVQPEPPQGGKDNRDHRQIHESTVNDLEERGTRSDRSDAVVDCESTEHSGNMSLVD